MRCIECRNEAVAGRSRCQQHGRGDPRDTADYGHGWQRLRSQVITPTTLCAWCHRPGTLTDPLELDHILPHTKGGSNDLSNVQPIHRSGNRAKGGRLEVRRCA